MAKLQRERADIESEADILKERWEKTHMIQQKLQIERDDAITEVDILKEKLDKSIYASQLAEKERDSLHREFEKVLEKYDKWVDEAATLIYENIHLIFFIADDYIIYESISAIISLG